MPKKKKTTAEKEPATNEKLNTFQVVLTCDGGEFKAEGETIEECLENLKPTLFKTRGLITAKSGDRESNVMLLPRVIRRLSVNKVLRAIIGKRLTIQL